MKPITLLCSLSLSLTLAAAGAGAADQYSLRDGTLRLGARAVLEHVPVGFTLTADPTATGVFLRYAGKNSAAVIKSPLGTIAGLKQFTSCHRDEPFWMLPATGRQESAVRPETQWLLAETSGGDCVMLVPLMDGPFAFTLSGDAAGLQLRGDTGDPAVTGKGGVALFVSVGADPYAMADAGAKAVMKHLGTGKLRREKPVPDFVNDFGWCTWNSFYQEVSAEKVKTGLQSFAAGKVEPRFLILDDGWQDYKQESGGENRLISLAPNQARFGGDLTATVKLSKQDFKVRTFLVWHAFFGYWGGLDGKALPDYKVKDEPRKFSDSILSLHPNLSTQWWGSVIGMVPADKIGKFYDDYHKRLKAQGVDGVKVDSQSAIEGVSTGLGGRVSLTLAYREALERSVAKYFNGRLINCMACAMETFYASPRSTLMRTSIDFWPNRPETHGTHIHCNALVGVWFGEFMQPDWDMFQSQHAMGGYHAAGRAVSGGPVYVSDTPEAHDFALLRKLVLSDGTVLRADNVGRPTRDCLFADVTHEPALLKVFNYNRDCAVIGAFNANYHADQAARVTITGTVSPADAPDLKGDDFAGFAQQGNRVWRCKRTDRETLKLAENGWEIVSYAPVEHGLAVLGLADKFNSTGAVMSKVCRSDGGACTVTLRDGGEFVAWAEKRPRAVQVNGQAVDFKYDAAAGRLSATLPGSGKQTVVLRWGDLL